MYAPNQLGNAERHREKSVRVATHVPVLQHCITSSRVKITHVLEHGMGLSSTPFFHTLPDVVVIASLENDERWRTCDTCDNTPDGKVHVIESYVTSIEFVQFVQKHTDPAHTLVFVDGPHLERINVLGIMQRLNVPFLVEHDAESLPEFDLHLRKQESASNGYGMYQYVALNPETMLYTRISPASDDYVEVLAAPPTLNIATIQS